MTSRPETSPNLPAVIDAGRRLASGGAGQRAHAAYAAQALGATGARRGLRGGAVVLDEARGAYLRAQWSGGDDRRLAPGAVRAASA